VCKTERSCSWGSLKILQLDYTLGLLDANDGYSTEIIRTKFTRDIASSFNIVCEELITGMDDLIPATEDSA